MYAFYYVLVIRKPVWLSKAEPRVFLGYVVEVEVVEDALLMVALHHREGLPHVTLTLREEPA